MKYMDASTCNEYKKKKAERILRLFIRYLKERGVYCDFITDFINQYSRRHAQCPPKSYKEKLVQDIYMDGVPNLINNALCWAHTNKGYDFWEEEDRSLMDANDIGLFDITDYRVRFNFEECEEFLLTHPLPR